MNLIEIVQKLYEVDDELTIYAKKPWTCGAEASLEYETDEELVPKRLEREGYEYFIEVFAAQEVVPNLSHSKSSFNLEQWCEKLIRYVEDDA